MHKLLCWMMIRTNIKKNYWAMTLHSSPALIFIFITHRRPNKVKEKLSLQTYADWSILSPVLANRLVVKMSYSPTRTKIPVVHVFCSFPLPGKTTCCVGVSDRGRKTYDDRVLTLDKSHRALLWCFRNFVQSQLWERQYVIILLYYVLKLHMLFIMLLWCITDSIYDIHCTIELDRINVRKKE